MKDLSNEDLVQIAGSRVIGTSGGVKAQQAQAELNKRLIESLEKLGENFSKSSVATAKFNKVTLDLTITMVFLAMLQIFTSAFSASFILPIKIGFVIAAVMILLMVLMDKN